MNNIVANTKQSVIDEDEEPTSRSSLLVERYFLKRRVLKPNSLKRKGQRIPNDGARGEEPLTEFFLTNV